jgi:hypothetical protein
MSDASHGFPTHVALVRVRSEHDVVVPLRVYPSAHVGVQEEPLASVSVQSPAEPPTG